MKRTRITGSIVPILIAGAAALAVLRYFTQEGVSAEAKSPERRVVELPPPAIVGYAQVKPGRVSPPEGLKPTHAIECSEDDAAVVWFALGENQFRLVNAGVRDENGRTCTSTFRRLDEKWGAVVIKRGYPVRPQAIGLRLGYISADEIIETEPAWLPIDIMPEPKILIDAGAKPVDDKVKATWSKQFNTLRVEITASDPRTEAISMRVLKTTFSTIPESWIRMTPISEGYYAANVMVPYSRHVGAIEVEVVEQSLVKESKLVRFASAKLTNRRLDLPEEFKLPEVRPGPMNTIVGLTLIHSTKPKRAGKYKGLICSVLTVQTNRRRDGRRSLADPLVQGEIVSPTAKELRISEHRLILQNASALGLELPKPSPGGESGSGEDLVVRLTASRGVELSRRKALAVIPGAESR